MIVVEVMHTIWSYRRNVRNRCEAIFLNRVFRRTSSRRRDSARATQLRRMTPHPDGSRTGASSLSSQVNLLGLRQLYRIDNPKLLLWPASNRGRFSFCEKKCSIIETKCYSGAPNQPMAQVPPSSLRPGDLLSGWWQILAGRVPLLSIEITRECPLSCPGCYAYGDTHLSGGVTLRDLNDFRDDKLVEGVIGLCKKHRPLQVSLVGGEPLMRRRELDRILPELSAMGIASMVVTSGVIPIPEQWDSIPRVRVAVSVDGLPEHHDIRRKPATYERILRNIAGRKINVHWVITKPMLMRPTYLEEYVAFWNAREEVDHIWLSLYTPQIGE